jgi:type IV secretion system protein VirB11
MINREAAVEINRRHIRTLTRELQPLIPLFEDKNLTNIYVYGNGRVKADDFIKGNYDTGLVIGEEARFRIINCLSSMSDTPIDTWANPTLESIIPDYNIRTTAILPPWVASPELTFRRPAHDVFPLEQYVNENRMTKEQYDTLVSHIESRSNILIGGGTGSGKTTFTNSCIEKMREFTPLERFYIVEDTPEILCRCENKTQVYIRKEQASQAIQTALRWCPKRIIFGELRSGVVAVELLEAWNTGHPGNITTLHADSAESMIRRLEGMLREVIQGKLPDLSFTIQLCVHLSYKPGFGPLVDEVTTVRDILGKPRLKDNS